MGLFRQIVSPIIILTSLNLGNNKLFYRKDAYATYFTHTRSRFYNEKQHLNALMPKLKNKLFHKSNMSGIDTIEISVSTLQVPFLLIVRVVTNLS